MASFAIGARHGHHDISLPDDLKQFVDARGTQHAYGSSSEYLRELIHKQRDVEALRNALLDGFNSGPAAPFDRYLIYCP